MIFPGLRLSQCAPLFRLILKTELHQLLILLDQIFKRRVCKVSPLDFRRLQNAVNLVLFFYFLIQMHNPSYGGRSRTTFSHCSSVANVGYQSAVYFQLVSASIYSGGGCNTSRRINEAHF